MKENKEIEKGIDIEITDEDKNHIAHQIQEGYQSGQFGGEGDKRISWELNAEIID